MNPPGFACDSADSSEVTFKMSANPFKRNRVDRVHFPPLEEALARPGRRTGGMGG